MVLLGGKNTALLAATKGKGRNGNDTEAKSKRMLSHNFLTVRKLDCQQSDRFGRAGNYGQDMRDN